MTPVQNPIRTEAVMSVSLSIKDVPEETLHQLRARAERNHRSLQKELLAIVEAAVGEGEPELTVDELAEFVKGLGLSASVDSTTLIRELRDGRY
jgi:plasmid stability protein